METPENQKEMLEIKNIATEMKNAFNGLTNKLGMAEECLSLWFSQQKLLKMKRKKTKKI